MSNFDRDEAKKFLFERETAAKEKLEQERQQIFQKVVAFLKEEFKGTDVEVYLVGSLLIPYRFTNSSDVDIVLKNFHEDRFDLWTKLEEKIGRKIEIILFEKCSFKKFVIAQGFKVI